MVSSIEGTKLSAEVSGILVVAFSICCVGFVSETSLGESLESLLGDWEGAWRAGAEFGVSLLACSNM